MTASKFKQNRRKPRRFSRRYDGAQSSESELHAERDYKDDDEDAAYTESESASVSPRKEFYSPEESESISETQFDTVNSVSNSQDLLQSSVAVHVPATYVNIAPLPTFHGTSEECPITHLNRFSKVCRANNALSDEMMTRIFPVTLENEAALWYDLEIDPYPSLTWEEIKSSFLNVYRNIDLIDKYRSELVTLKQGENESVRAFYLRMQGILRIWSDHGIEEEVLKGIFIDGLRQDFQDWIDPQKPNSLHEVLSLALTWEQAKSVRAMRKGSCLQIKCGFCDGPHEERVCEIKEKMRELWFRIKEKKRREIEAGKVVGPKKDNVRTISIATSSNVKQQGEGDGNEGARSLSFRKKSQCQCGKHECWKKMERNNSVLSRTSKEG
ncbi:hypothetical protein ACHQM5_008546 [Ranunculus cassubicifolius]